MLSNLKELADKNRFILEKLDFDPLKDDPDELNNPQVFFESGLFPESKIETIFSETHHDNRFADTLIPSNIGALLIRPDMVQSTPDVEEFIAARFRIIHQETIKLDAQQYWDIYAPAIVGRETESTRLTRAAVYIGSPCRLMVFIDPSEGDIATADKAYVHHKGRQGEYMPDTLRGDVVYRHAINDNFHLIADERYHNPGLRLAIDPFGAYKKVAKSLKPQINRPFPVLQFTGVGIHVPNYEEIHSDLEVMTNYSVHKKIIRARDANTISI